MSEEEKTINFLINKIKQLELDVQYQLHQANEAKRKYIDLKAKLYEILRLI